MSNKLRFFRETKVVKMCESIMFFFYPLYTAAREDGENGQGFKKSLLPITELGCLACAVISACTLTMASPVIAANQVSHIYVCLCIKNLDYSCFCD